MNAASRLLLVQQRHHAVTRRVGTSLFFLANGRRQGGSSVSTSTVTTCAIRSLSSSTSKSTSSLDGGGGGNSAILQSSSLLDDQKQYYTDDAHQQSNYGRTDLSSISEPDPTLFWKAKMISSDGDMTSASAAAKSSTVVEDTDAQLRSDIRSMGSLLGKIVREHEGEEIFEKIESMRLLAKKWRAEELKAAFAELATFASNLSDQELYTVTRAFTHFLAIANAAEGHHRVRRLRESSSSSSSSSSTYPAPTALYAKPDSCGGVLPRLLEQGHDKEEIWQALCSQTTELVLTAHPTEVNRRTILSKKRRIQEILTQADAHRQSSSADGKSFVMQELDDALHREIESIWLSDEVSRTKPTPETEAEKGTAVVDTVLWDTVPKFLRKLNATCKEFLDRELPLDIDASPIRFASWMGGDRDGNPNVKPSTTRIVCLRNRGTAATLLQQNLRQLESELSLTTCSDAVRALVGDDAREPYRALLRKINAKLGKTNEWVEQEMSFYSHHLDDGTSSNSNSKPTVSHHAVDAISESEIYLDKQELMDELMLIHTSLTETGNKFAADGLLTDVIRNLAAFGLTLIPLDIRQESDRHTEALDAITRYLGVGSYEQWDEQTRINWLSAQITSKRPLIRSGIWKTNPDYFSDTAIDTLETFEMIADQHEGSLGAYVISQATTASDVLAVLLLQIDAGVQKPLRVVPLFETLDDLNGAMDTMKTLFSLPAYMGLIAGKQEVMIGYSDSAKDAGRLAASWAQYETQEQLAALAREMKVELTFFHGKGGTVGRGGNPQTFLAIMSHAPQTINGHFRVTEQGEMISQNFGFYDRAERSMVRIL